jgi:hypothetical protein
VTATFTGVHAYDDRLPDWSPDGLQDQDDEMHALGTALAAEFPAPGSPASFRSSPDLLDAELARGFLEIQRAENASPHGPRGNPALWTGEEVFSIISLMIRDFAPLEERVAAAVERLEGIPQFLCSEPEAGHPERSEGLSLGMTPAAWKARAIRDCEGAEILLTTGIERWIAATSIPAADSENLLRSAAKARRAFTSFVHRLESEPDAPESAMSCGPDLFDLLLARGHFCTRSRDDLLRETRDRFDAAHAELETLAHSVSGSLADAQAQLAQEHPTPDEYFAAFETTWLDCYERADQANAASWPDWPIRYVPYPEWTADAAPYLYYLFYRSPAPFDPYTVYDYVVPPVPADVEAAEKHLRVWNNSTIKLNHVVHHGAIGHHVQNYNAYAGPSAIGRVAAVDCANRIGMFSGGTMAEGWACYATDLMEELGFLTPLERVSQQHTRVRMLARAIVDIELHQGTMSFPEAVAFYADGVGMSPDAAKGEAVKNSMFPCTALMYWLGTQGIHELREEMKRREGRLFSLRRFHGELLGYGSIPVPLIARIMTSAPTPLPGR